MCYTTLVYVWNGWSICVTCCIGTVSDFGADLLTEVLGLLYDAVCCNVTKCVAVCCRVLQCVAVCCSMLQCVAVCCSALHCDLSTEVLWLLCDVVCRSVLQCVAMCCNVVQCGAVSCCVAVWSLDWGVVVAMWRSVSQCAALRWGVLQCVTVCSLDWGVVVAIWRSISRCVAVCCSVSQCVAMCCSVLQRVAACCSVLQCVAVCCSVIIRLRCCGCYMMQCVVVYCNVLQRAAVCCSMIVGLRCCVCYMTHACVLCNTSISSTCHIHLCAMTNWVCVRLWPIFRVRFCGFYTSHLYVLCYTTLPYAWHDASKCAMWWNVPCDSQLWHKSSAHLSIYVPPYVIYDMTLWPWHDSSARCGFHRSHPYVLYDTSICVTWRINMCHVTHNCDMTHPLVCPYMCLHMYFVIWPYDRDMTHPLTFWYMRIYMCDMTKK